MRLSIPAFSSLAAALVLAACGGDGTGPVRQDLDDASLAAITALPLSAGALEAPPGGTLPAPTCTYQEASGRFECDAITRQGLTFTRSFTFLDAAGRPQRRFDPVTTASINTRIAIVGTTAAGQGTTIKMDRHGEMTVSGLAGTETSQTLNGVESGTTEVKGTGPFGDFETRTASIDSTVDVVVPLPPRPVPGERPAPVFPLSGKRISNRRITSSAPNFLAPGGVGAPTEIAMREVITYTGTSKIVIERTIDGTTHTCSLDFLVPSSQSCMF